ncbi:MAG: HD domain-containing protein [Candidatus Latescibacteria bacterium]|nr:HD domain-containing protein [Candidatus Latescibacterota bacterium]
MRLCPVKDLLDGMVLGKSIYQGGNRLLLGAGFRINGAIRQKLIQKGYSHVYIMEEGTEDIIPEDIISDEIKLQASAKLTDARQQIEDEFKFKDMTRSKVVELLRSGHFKNFHIAYDVRKLVEEILKDISSVGAKFLNTLMVKSADRYFVDHAINTAILAIILGKRYRYTKKELRSLAIGCFLHDIGKVIIDQMTKDAGEPDNLLYNEHPTFRYLLLSNDNAVSPVILQIVNQHHEMQDGSGFPIGLKGQNLPPVKNDRRETKGYIYRMAEICIVANTYDNLVLNPLGNELLPPQDVLKKMLTGAGTLYNRDIVQTLSRVIAVYPVGSYVKIVNIVDPALIGSYGVVAKVIKENLGRPVIIITTNKYKKKIKPIMINTANLKFVELELVI